MTGPLLRVKDLSVALGGARPVESVSFEIDAGETFALLGESGCGKSMSALALIRLLPPGAQVAGGQVEFDGQDLNRLTEAEMRPLRGGALGMIFQEPAVSLNPVLTIGRQMADPLALHKGLTGAVARRRAEELLAAVGIPDPARRVDEYPFQLSGGMKQRAMIAMALAGEPRLLIADEPTTALDVTIQAQVLDLLREVQRQRATAMLLISHDLGVVSTMADRVGVMYAGELVEIADRNAFFRHAAHPYSRRLFEALPESGRRGQLATIPGNVPPLGHHFAGCRFSARCRGGQERCRHETPGWSEIDSGHRVRCHFPEAGVGLAVPASHTAMAPVAETLTAPLLQVENLQVHFPIRRGLLKRPAGYVKAVDGVSLTLAPGRTLALVGESGCGKTTAGKAILRLLQPTAGTVRLAGGEVATIRGREMQMVFQDPFGSLNPRLRVGEIIAEGMAAQGLPITQGDLDAVMQQVGLSPEMAKRYPHEFSGGQRQRIAIARALAVEPKLLICDEPTSALDVSVQAQILNLLRDLQIRLGLAYLFITHNIAVVDFLAHEVAVMYLGRIVEQGQVDDVLRGACHPYTQALLAAVPRVEAERNSNEEPYVRVAGDLPSPANPPVGCHFHPRCPKVAAICREKYPAARAISASHRVHCHFPGMEEPGH
ncbi:MAG: ABC transporter ATP-binding protein [Rhodocyclaceae bacterium]|nr:ABC transporter ATP-binding protein [Rhodocyclaceae bacterium]